MPQIIYDASFLRQVIRGEIWFKKCPDCEATGVTYKDRCECKNCEGLGYIPVQGYRP